MEHTFVTNGDFMVYVCDSAAMRPSSQNTSGRFVYIVHLCCTDHIYHMRTAEKDGDKDEVSPANTDSHSDAGTSHSTTELSVCNDHVSTDSNSHQSSHTVDSSACTAANKGLRRKITRTKRRIRAVKRLHCCSVCLKKFPYPSHLQLHMRTHTREKPFDCDVCQKKFTRSHDLRRHTLLHSGEKPFSCSLCGRQFSHSSRVKMHMRTHHAQQQHSGNVDCDESAADTGSKHRMHSRAIGRPYSCGLCSRRFTRCSDLRRHMQLHTGDQPFSCRLCLSLIHISEPTRPY